MEIYNINLKANMKEIKLSLTIDEMNFILEALSSMPFGRVYQFIDKLQNQANACLKEEEVTYGEL